jgi:signal transduction histidine kinase
MSWKVASWATRLAAPVVAPLLELKVLASFLSATFVVVLATAVYMELKGARSTREALDLRRATIDALEQTEMSLLDAETGQRGYLLTGRSVYLQPYQAALPRLDGLFAQLERSTAGDATQHDRLERLRGLVGDKLEELSETIDLSDERRPAAAAAIVDSDWGKHTMDQARALIGEMARSENALLEIDRAVHQREQRQTEIVLIAGSLGAFILTILLNMAIRGDVAQRRSASALIAEQTAQLKEANRELGRAHEVVASALQQREEALAKLQTSNQELDQFAYVTAHDLKAPLRGIANLAEWITEDLGASISDAAKENLGLLRKRAKHMEALINGILEYSRAGRKTGALETVDLQEMVAEILQLIAPAPDRYTIRIPDRLPVLRAPRMTFERIWTNLLSNAVKFSPQSGAIIDVTARVDRGAYEFCVADNGIGLSERDLHRVFTLFHRVTAQAGVEGMGIGLAVVKKLVDSLGGRVWVESVLGGGSRFYFTFPAAEPQSGADDIHARATT